jgi:hypothetical protein
LPVVPGAILAELSGSALALHSPIPRERAFLDIVSARERIAGAIVPLAVADDGSAMGRFELDPELAARLAAEPTWAVVSSEYDKRSPGVVGWPLQPAFDASAPRLTFGVPDQILLDGRNGALFDMQRRDRGRRGTAAAALVVVGALLGAAFWSEVRRGRRSTAVARHAASDGDERPATTPAGWLLGAALGCIALGFGALAYFGWLAH